MLPERRVAESTVFEDLVIFLKLPKIFTSRFLPGITTQSVKDCIVYTAGNTAPVTITNFKEGSDGQTIKILGDGNTTIAHNTNIKTNTGANKLLASNTVYTFTLISEVWYEDE